MYSSAYDFKAFYTSRIGRVVRRIVQERVREFWSDVHGLRVMGYGYPVPYMRMFMEEAERIFTIMPAAQGAHVWPHDGKNLVAVSEESAIPIETSSVDRILMMHALEFSEQLPHNLCELYRILKPNGRLLVVVPNRAGMWAHAEWSPMGQGTPYSVAQLSHYLRDHKFIQERVEEALFMPPYKSSLLMKSARTVEGLGKTFLPFVAGLHMVEVSKQVYARPNTPSGNKAPVTRGVRLFGGKVGPVPDGAGRIK
ncbi:MAG: methyltransferase [Micavibrio sp.]|nr:methyltransferase [Micavibrio sp.]|tara:strand:- start:292 stop:1050 length:759 start_codon:yes stop_codon:yes gene_type:complete